MSPMLAMLAIALFTMRFMAPKICTENKGIAAIGALRYKVALAMTPREWEHGLSGKTALAPDEGMLFLFPEDTMRSFWMKDMHFPIDIIWIDGDWTIVGIQKHATPESYPTIYPSPMPVRRVLEVPSQSYDLQTFRLGDTVKFGCI